jgi:putative membrane protein
MKTSHRTLAIAVAVIALAPIWASAQVPSDVERYGYGPHMMWWAGGWPGMIFGLLMMMIMFAAAIGVVWFFARTIGGSWHGGVPPYHPAGRTALDILKERFARGEIDKQEFEERRRVLGE